ncbi:hypothetical protein B0H66DRAFT_596950 [Apodospora peruviana]|uniref:Heavy metal tolerance protein n=1 Tax=Apodospora peruviana TaxID=516989 RepID=A0AAE0IQC9_9PEZI|nr:hypothetical protein B0H66DRAFT_596950 [Apodospora peruviana]
MDLAKAAAVQRPDGVDTVGNDLVVQSLVGIHYALPAAVFVYYAVSYTFAICTLQTVSSEENHGRRRTLMWCLFFGTLTYVAQLLSLLFQTTMQHRFPVDHETIIGLLSCILVFGLQFSVILETSKPVWYPYTGSLLLGLVFETVTTVLALTARPQKPLDFVGMFDISVAAVRYLTFLVALAASFGGRCHWRRKKGADFEREALLEANGHTTTDASDEQTNGNGQANYGTTPINTSKPAEASTKETPWQKRRNRDKALMDKALQENGSWLMYAKRFTIFLPYVWPVNRPSLQVRLVLVGLCLLAGNFLNVLIPRQTGILMDSLNGNNDQNPWIQVLIFVGLRLVSSEAGIPLLRQWLWFPLDAYSTQSLRTAAYSHILRLSSDFHDSKSYPEIAMAIYHAEGVTGLIEEICFSAIPNLIDMVAAFVYLSITFGSYEGFITVATATVFLYSTSRMIAAQTKTRVAELDAMYEASRIQNGGIQGWTTVTAFNQVPYEEDRQSSAVKKFIVTWRVYFFWGLAAKAFQALVLTAGLLAGAFLAVYQVSHGQATAGQFIMLITYWAQLSSPLMFFSMMGKKISTDLLDATRLLDIMLTKSAIVSKEGAPPLEFKGGHVKFNNVCFSYDKKKEILKDINFSVSPGMTVAFVGTTGAGKSTILKLLHRLRAQIGSVPQSPILFSDTIMNNVRYAKLDATDEEVFEACKAACIHEQILGMTDGYQTHVGESSSKISGGELQRLAIARAILKRPAIVLLDEATSAVDTETECKIQDALNTLCQARTTFIVAHRLSTIMNADRIMVIQDGRVSEQGTHEELIRARGKYADLWSKQTFVRPKAKSDEMPDLLNDLTAESINLELAKVQKPLPLKTSHSNQANGSTTNGAAPVDDAKTDNSRLNPSAPPFQPRSQASTMCPDLSSSRGFDPSGDSESSTGTTFVSYGLHAPNLQYFATPLVTFSTSNPAFQSNTAGFAAEEDEKPEATCPKGPSSPCPGQTKPGPGWEGPKYPCYSRRIQSKSEPLEPHSSPSP